MGLTPDFSIVVNGKDSFPKERVLSIKTHDEAGIISDSCEFELDDYDDVLLLPNTEAKIELSLGYKESGLTKIGTYFVREISIDGARRVVKVKANAATKAMRSQKTQNNSTSLKIFSEKSASELGYSSSVDNEYSDIELEDEPQFGESDVSYLTRIAQKNGAVVKPVDGHLIVANDMSGKSTSGKKLPVKTIDAVDIASYSCSFRETESGGGAGTIYANWYNEEKGDSVLVHAGEGAPETELKEIFKDEKSALAACKARLKRIIKSNKSFNFSCVGRVDLFAESPIILHGFSKKIPVNWIITRVEHNLSSSGFNTSVECVRNGG